MRNRWQERQVGDISTRLVLRSNEETVCQREENALKARKKWKWSQSLILSSLFSFSFSLPFLLLFLLNFLPAISSPFLLYLFLILFLSATFLFFCILLFTLLTPFLPQFCFSYFTLFSYFSSSFYFFSIFLSFSFHSLLSHFFLPTFPYLFYFCILSS